MLKIYQQSVATKAMPIGNVTGMLDEERVGNVTGMLDEEREFIGRWYTDNQ